jgi:hypothetical protein
VSSTDTPVGRHARVAPQVNAVYRLAYPKFNILGALTVRGQVEVQGSWKSTARRGPGGGTLAGICPAAWRRPRRGAALTCAAAHVEKEPG